MTDKKLEDVAEDLKRRMGYTTGPINTDDAKEKKHAEEKKPMNAPKLAFELPHVPGKALTTSPWGAAKGVGNAVAGAMKKPPPLPAAALGVAKKMASAELECMEAGFLDELGKIAEDLTEAARSHIAKKNFAVSSKESNTGKPAYPIEDKAHARAALGFAAMHHDKKDLAEVKAKVEHKFPGMVHEKKAYLDPFSIGTGALGYMNGRNAQARGEDAPEITAGKVIGGVLIPPYGTYQLGKHLGHAHAEMGAAGKKHKKKEAGVPFAEVFAASVKTAAELFKEAGLLGSLGKA